MMTTTRTLRLAGADVPRIGLGENRLTNTADNVAFLPKAVDAGLRHIDTVHLYTGGESEEAIGVSSVTVERIERAREIVAIAAVQNAAPREPRAGGRDRPVRAARHRLRPVPPELAALLRRSPVVAPIPGTLSIDQGRENLAALDR